MDPLYARRRGQSDELDDVSRTLEFRDRTGRIAGPVWILAKSKNIHEVIDAFVSWRERTRTGRVCELQHILSVEQGLRANVTADRRRAARWARALKTEHPFRVCTRTCAI